MRIGCFVALLALGAALGAEAQGLGDAAARERQKRKAQPAPAPAKVFTDADLPKDGAPASGSAPDATAEKAGDAASGGEAAAAGQAGDAARDGTGEPELDPLERERQQRKLLEAEWRMRFAGAREQVALAEAACWREVVRTEYYQGIPVQMKVKEFVESEELRQARRAFADLEEEFRRTGLPPGWAREP